MRNPEHHGVPVASVALFLLATLAGLSFVAAYPLPEVQSAAEVVQQIVAKTDGVPLFVEELTKSVVEQHVGAIHESPLQPVPTNTPSGKKGEPDRNQK